MTLPIDYYILLQDGYEQKTDFIKTNYIMLHNIPLFSKQQTYFKQTSPIKTTLLNDVHRCTDRQQAENLLNDSYAENEVIRLLESRYGEIDDFVYINYNIEKILNKIRQMTQVDDAVVKKDYA